ncbi:Isochorismate hydrolase [Actinokineospora globicatena]|nr:Isochorismate hydrolase [Actinokineospora globicatena]GLW79725.1 phenazine biosynthesis protein PhzD [Actinokineospora globicatena]GLW85865.1 phenazine biosynthesis protein PhzD [Actinokineospora globicatena]
MPPTLPTPLTPTPVKPPTPKLGLPPIPSYALPTAGEVPASTAPWVVDPDRAVLLVHDMQRYFLAPLPEQPRAELVANAVALRDRADALGMPVAYTVQPGGMTPADRGLQRDIWGPGMRVDPEDRLVVDPLAPRPDDWLSTKWRYSAFFRSDLLERLRDNGRDQLVLCGVYAHLGVLVTAIDAYSNDIEAFLVADAVADFSAEHHRGALAHAASSCAVVLTTKEVLP